MQRRVRGVVAYQASYYVFALGSGTASPCYVDERTSPTPQTFRNCCARGFGGIDRSHRGPCGDHPDTIGDIIEHRRGTTAPDRAARISAARGRARSELPARLQLCSGLRLHCALPRRLLQRLVELRLLLARLCLGWWRRVVLRLPPVLWFWQVPHFRRISQVRGLSQIKVSRFRRPGWTYRRH